MSKKQKLFVKILRVVLSMLLIVNALPLTAQNASAKEGMTGYTNPEDIIIASPNSGYKTQADHVSILGACDYRYPLYMNGEEIATTQYGFFTEYVALEVGENEFVFTNHESTKTLKIVRKEKPVTSTGGSNTSSGTSTAAYKAYTSPAYGVITGNYAMPRTKVSSSDLSTIPITRGTVVKLLGEEKSYYKIADGTFVSKSSITKYNKAVPDNQVTDAQMSYEKDRNQILTKLSVSVNSFYRVKIEGREVTLTLFDTISGANISVPENDTVASVTMARSSKKRQVSYCFTLYEDAQIFGYDVLFNKGVMKFELKVAPHLTAKGDLTGTTVFLDAGHGATDSGAVGPLGKYGPMEKDTNLSIMLYAKEYLEGLGATVVTSRSDDTFFTLNQRVSMIRNLRPDISVSVHGNSLAQISDYSNASGFLTYYSYLLNGDVPSKINQSIAASLGFTEKASRQKSLSLTRFTTCPSVLLETKFLSNPSDYEYLIQDENQKAFGEAIGKAVQEYLEEIAIYPVIEYCVKKGDSLTRIAARYHVDLDQLAKFNGITDYNYIEAGQILKIPEY